MITPPELIANHLGPNWTRKQFSTTDLASVVDRLQEECGLGLRAAVKSVYSVFVVEIIEACVGDYKIELIGILTGLVTYFNKGDVEGARTKIYNEFRKNNLSSTREYAVISRLMNQLRTLITEMGIDPREVPEE
jgi:hypothetical protein